MAILRVGPWGYWSGFGEVVLENEPADVTDINYTYWPVNCADTDWVSGAVWQQLIERTHALDEPFFGYPLRSLNIKGEGGVSYYDFVYVRHWFNYQATEDFDLTLTWDYQADGGDMTGFNYTDPYANIRPLGQSTVNLTTTGTQSGSHVFTFPAATFATAEVYVGGNGFDFYTLTTTLG